MLQRLYYRLLLAVLPSVESHLLSLSKTVKKLDAFTDRIEHALEEEVVKLANDAHNRRKAIEAVEATYDRRRDSSVGFIDTVRTDLEKASAARDAVAKIIGL